MFPKPIHKRAMTRRGFSLLLMGATVYIVSLIFEMMPLPGAGEFVSQGAMLIAALGVVCLLAGVMDAGVVR